MTGPLAARRAVDRPAVGRSGGRLRRLVAAAAGAVLHAVERQRPRVGRGVLCAGAAAPTTRTTWPRCIAPTAPPIAPRTASTRSTPPPRWSRSASSPTPTCGCCRSLFTAYVMWSPWHYSGQNYGLLMMFVRRAGLDGVAGAGPAAEAGLRRVVRDAAGRVQRGTVVGSDGAVARPAHGGDAAAGWLAAAVFLGLGASTLWPVVRGRRRGGGRAAAPVLHPGTVVRRADRDLVGGQRCRRRRHATAPGSWR